MGVSTNLALVEVVNDGVIERFFELSLCLGAMELKLGATHVIRPLDQKETCYLSTFDNYMKFIFCDITKTYRIYVKTSIYIC